MSDEPETWPNACCQHCGCPDNERVGHDDTCAYGCNDVEPVPVEKKNDLTRALTLLKSASYHAARSQQQADEARMILEALRG